MGNYLSPTTINFSEGTSNMFSYLNTVTVGWFSNLLLISVFIILWFGYYNKEEDALGAFAVSSYITFFLSLILLVMEALDYTTLMITLGLSILSTAMVLIRTKN